MLHPDLFRIGQWRALFSFPDCKHVVIVLHIGAEEQHAAAIVTDLRKTQYLSEKPA
jgi:hypothetical protein